MLWSHQSSCHCSCLLYCLFAAVVVAFVVVVVVIVVAERFTRNLRVFCAFRFVDFFNFSGRDVVIIAAGAAAAAAAAAGVVASFRGLLRSLVDKGHTQPVAFAWQQQQAERAAGQKHKAEATKMR